MKILFAEDEEHIAKLISFVLTKDGHQLAWAKDGQEALDILQNKNSEKFDLLMLDVMMPRATGWDVLKYVRTDPLLKGLKVLMLTAKNLESDHQESSRLGADVFLNKPFKPDDLRECLRRLSNG